ncbi:MAG TPA: serine/threonine protein kinase, partial [Polyangiaceae bacterium]
MEASDSRAQERVGTVLNDKWTLERLLGVGGMAAVYAARHRNGARAAVKVLHPDLSRHREVRE